MYKADYTVPPGLERKFIVRPDGSYRSMQDVLEQSDGDDAENRCFEANKDFLEKVAGCESQRLLEEAWRMLLQISPDSSFSHWENESGSGVSCRALIGKADGPGAFLALIALLRQHNKAEPSGELTISWRNSQQQSGRPQGRR